jgi:hypothetical protein
LDGHRAGSVDEAPYGRVAQDFPRTAQVAVDADDVVVAAEEFAALLDDGSSNRPRDHSLLSLT